MRPDNGEKSPHVAAADESKSVPLSLESVASQVASNAAREIHDSKSNMLAVAATQCPTCGLTVMPGTQVCPIDGTPLSDTPAPGLADKYEFLDVLGQGGMAIVHRARHLLLGNTVAIKLLNPNAGYNAIALRRFRQEAAAAKKVEHPNVIRIHDFGITPSGQPYMVMDCLEGETLEERIKKDGAVAIAQAIPLFKQICLALEHMHTNNVLHRDLKPSNVFLTKSTDPNNDAPTVKLVDFGIAKVIDENSTGSNKLTATGDIFGTPHYMSPQQCQGNSVTRVSDIYSLGCLMYETLSGRPPFEGDNPLAVMHQHLHENPPHLTIAGPLSTQKELEEIIFKCLEKDPALRYQSASNLLADLSKFEAGNFRRQPITHKIQSFVRKRRAAVAVAGVTALAAVAGIAFLAIHGLAPSINHHQTAPHSVSQPAPHLVAPPKIEVHVDGSTANIPENDYRVVRYWETWRGRSSLSFQGTPISASSMKFIGQLTTLRDLNLTGCPITDFGGKQLSNLRNLERLDLTDTAIGDDTVKSLSTLHNLTMLDLSKSRISADVFKFLAQLPRLGELYINETPLKPSDLHETCSLPALTKLHIANMPVTEKSLAVLPSRLLWLDLSNTGLTDLALDQIVRFPHLQNLNLEHNPAITDAGLSKIGELKDLEYVYLEGTAVTTAGLRQLRGLHKLKLLYIGSTRVDSLAPLSGLTTMTELEINGLGLTDRSLSDLSALKNLQRLYLDHNNISSSGLRSLRSFSNLRMLSVDKQVVIAPNGSFRKDAAKTLAGFAKFETLGVSGLSAEIADRLSQELPFTVQALN
ncbi:MAG TPA: protein kinase [Candidatus Obscuribacterales bacterium]